MRYGLKRRDFLLVAAMAAVTGCDAAGDRPAGRSTASPKASGSPARLSIPPLLEPAADADGVKVFRLTMRKGRTEFLAGRPAPTWGFNGSYLGPTLRAARGDRVRVEVVNGIGEDTTVHWHGLRVPAEMDGGPHRIIGPGATWSPHWTVDQPAATAW
ncbi:multicopper oxidase domain-containing protein [Streptomyces sp. NPDC048606]|uniref:multicopper oxidase domain-containing protein n=1 Tax=Streptomyces sp. NPDC048606 TaxID=3154726 RepID=UPI0034267627